MAINKELRKKNEKFAAEFQCKKYKDLKLKNLLNKLDFAHYTYESGQCSCCYGPIDMDKKYWKDEKTYSYYVEHEDDNPQFILFKNSDNSYSGTVNGECYLVNENVCWILNDENLEYVIKYLKETLGDNYLIIEPEDDYTCIKIVHKDYEANSKRIYGY